MEKRHPNIDLIHEFFNAYATNNHEVVRQVLSDDIQWHIPGNHPLSGTKSGVDQVIDYLKQLNKASFQAAPIVMGVNDSFVIDCHRNWSELPDGDNLDNMSCLLWKIKDNRIIEVFNFPENQHTVDAFFSRVYSGDQVAQ